MNGRGRTQAFSQAVGKGAKLPPEALSWWWHPNRTGVPSGPRFWQIKLAEIDPDLAVTEDRYNQKLCVWMRKPAVQSKVCWGWTLLFATGKDTPIELVCARLYEASARKWGGARQYFDAIEREMARDREKAEKASLQDSIDSSMEVFNYSQIKNIGRGSKFSTYHQ